MPFKVTLPSQGVSSRSLMRAQRQVASHTQNMVTGKRINQASDDAANAGVVVNLSAQKTGTRMALRNIADRMSIVSTMDEAASQVAEKIKRMRELAIQGSSEILENPERRYLQKEMQALQDEMDVVAATTNFNGLSLTDGSSSAVTVQIGANNSQSDRLKMKLHELTTTAVFDGNVVDSWLNATRLRGPDDLVHLDLKSNLESVGYDPVHNIGRVDVPVYR